jgi:hypothetical protein
MVGDGLSTSAAARIHSGKPSRTIPFVVMFFSLGTFGDWMLIGDQRELLDPICALLCEE